VNRAEHERRAHARVRFKAEAVIFLQDRLVGVYDVRDISVGGAFVVGNEPLEVGSTIGLQLRADSFGAITVHATVVRSQACPGASAYGLQFLKPSSKIACMIEDVVLAELERIKLAESSA
jgi:hypothetical protein